MPSSEPITVSLTLEPRRFTEAQVASGRYGVAGAVARAGLRLLTAADPPRLIGARGTPTSITQA